MRRWLAETRVYAGITLAVYFDMIPRLTTDAVATGSDHAGAEFVENLERRLVAVQAKLALELDGRDAWRMARNEVGKPEDETRRTSRTQGCSTSKRRASRGVAGAQAMVEPFLPNGPSARPTSRLWLSGSLHTFLQRWASLGTKTVYSWLDDRAPTIGAAIAFYTMFSLAPMLVIVIAVAGFVFGQEAAEGALFGELTKLVGPDNAGAVQAMLRSASSARSGIIATVVGMGTLLATATAVFSELQAALNLIWKVPATANPGLSLAHFFKSRLLNLCVIFVIGFLLLVSLVISTALMAFSDYLDRTLPNSALILYLIHHALSFGFTTVFFAAIFKILPDHPVEWQDVWLGAALTALLFSLGKHLISLYSSVLTCAVW